VESVIEDAAADERLALRALALGVAAVGAFFATQVTIRQTRRELTDRDTLESIGVTRRQLRGLVVLRWLPSAVAGVVVAVGLTAGLTAFGPLGVGRRAPWSAEPVVDVPAAIVATIAVAALVLGAAAFAAGRPPRVERRPTTSVRSPLPLPVWVTAATLRPSLRRGSASALGAAVAGTAVAAAAFIAAAAVADTLDAVVADPARTGADFDALVWANDLDDAKRTAAEVAELDGVARASTMTGTTITIDETEVWVHAFAPIDGLPRIAPVITGGREPVDVGEIALAELTMDEIGAQIGDTLTVEPYVAGRAVWEATVVGTALVNDLWEPSAGRGGIVSAETAAAHFEEETPNVAVTFSDDEAGTAAREHLANRMQEADAPRSVAYVARLDWVPFVLAAIAAVMAAITFVHALSTTVRGQRKALATYRVLGLSRARAIGIVLLESTVVALAALAIAVPLGLILGRWGWELVNDRLGLATSVELPIRSIAVAVLAVLGVGVVVAGPIGRRATTGSIASAIRAE
jgi:putative ABC transport system permease protein